VFAPLDPATGSLVGSSVFASSQNCTVAYGARLNGNKIYMLADCITGGTLMIFDTISNSFTQIYTVVNGILKEFVIDTTGDL